MSNMSKTRTCPYYIVHDEEQWKKALAVLGAFPDKKRLHDFPMKIGRDGIVFQEAGQGLIPAWLDEKTGITYDYVLTELP